MKRPNLPQLDQVEFQNSWLMAEGFGSASTLGKITAALGLVESTLRGLELLPFTLYNHALALIVLGFTIYIILFVTVHYVRSDERGLTIHRLLHHQFIKWDDIREVIVRQSQMCNEPDGYVLVGRDQRIWLPLSFPRRMDVVLTASIRQHLLAVGKVDNVPFLKEAEDLWWAAPDWVTSESEWTNSHAPDWKIYYKMLLVKSIAIAVLLSIGAAVFGWEKTKAVVILAVFFIGGLYAALYFFLYRMRTVAEWVRVDSDGIEVVNGFGKISLRWQNIRESGWDSEGLYLAAKFPRVLVRLPDNPSASEFHLCILKKLRTLENHKWIEIPVRLGGLTHAVMGTHSEQS